MMNRFCRLLTSCTEIKFVQQALAADIDLSCINRRPTPKEKFGVFLVLLSYVIGWPAVAFFGFMSLYLRQPLVLIIGGPLTYGISHAVFLVGVYIAGKDYARVFMKWSIKKVCEKLSAAARPLPADAVKAK